MSKATGIDTSGPWFDGVKHLSQKNGTGAVNADAAKCKEIAIVGAGMSGLMTYMVLSQAGLTNVTIHEAGQRLGGRVHTAHLSGGPSSSSYQEMGPMRFPYSLKSPATNKTVRISDHQLVFDLAKELNKLNHHHKNWSVNFIPWIQNNENNFYYMEGFKLPNGLPPTLAQVKAMQKNGTLPSSTAPESPGALELEKKLQAYEPTPKFIDEIATNIWDAHRDFEKGGLKGMPGDHWSEFGFLVNFLNGTLDAVDGLIGMPQESFWQDLYGVVYDSAASWKTIHGGLNRLPLAFHPLVDKVTHLNRNIEKINYSNKTEKVTLQWRDSYADRHFKTQSFDYALVSLPMTVLRSMILPTLETTMTNAINNVPYTSACKVALEYSERFWEHYDNPIYGAAVPKPTFRVSVLSAIP